MTTDQKLIEDALNRHPHDTIRIIDQLELDQIAVLLETLSWGHACLILESLSLYSAGKLLTLVQRDTALVLLEHLPQKEAVTIMLQLGKSLRDELLSGLPSEVAKHLSRAMHYPPDTIGSFIEPTMVISEALSIGEALDLIRKSPSLFRYHIYVIGKKQVLKGYLTINSLLAGDGSEALQSLVHEDVVSFLPHFTVAEALDQWDYHFTTLPVTDVQRRFLGTVTRSSLIHQEPKPAFDKDAVQAGNALGDLYLIGLTSLFGTSSAPRSTPKP